jgi:ABC-2 type transport system ATP-binding protein
MVLKGYGVQQEGVMIEFAIRTDGLAKSFGQTQALRDVSLQVPTGSIICVLGRNGAGKTTTVRILTTLIQPDEGVAEVAGFDTASQPQRVRARIGVAGQGTTLDQLLTGRQNLEVIGRLYHLGAARSRERAEELLKEFGLTEAAGRQVKTYSGGMRRRLDLAASLLPDPQVLFLDEPTTGLDPISRTALWQTIRDYAAHDAGHGGSQPAGRQHRRPRRRRHRSQGDPGGARGRDRPAAHQGQPPRGPA